MSLIDKKFEIAAQQLADSEDEVLQTAGMIALMRLETLKKRLKGSTTRALTPLTNERDKSNQGASLFPGLSGDDNKPPKVGDTGKKSVLTATPSNISSSQVNQVSEDKVQASNDFLTNWKPTFTSTTDTQKKLSTPFEPVKKFDVSDEAVSHKTDLHDFKKLTISSNVRTTPITSSTMSKCQMSNENSRVRSEDRTCNTLFGFKPIKNEREPTSVKLTDSYATDKKRSPVEETWRNIFEVKKDKDEGAMVPFSKTERSIVAAQERSSSLPRFTQQNFTSYYTQNSFFNYDQVYQPQSLHLNNYFIKVDVGDFGRPYAALGGSSSCGGCSCKQIRCADRRCGCRKFGTPCGGGCSCSSRGSWCMNR